MRRFYSAMIEGSEIRELAHEEDSSGSDDDSGTGREEVTGPPEPK